MNYAESINGLTIDKELKEQLIVGLCDYINTRGSRTSSGICHGVGMGIRYHFENSINSSVFYGMYEYFNIKCLSYTKSGKLYNFNYVREAVSKMLVELFERDDVLIYTNIVEEQVRIVCKSDDARNKVFEIRKYVYENTCNFGSLGKPQKNPKVKP